MQRRQVRKYRRNGLSAEQGRQLIGIALVDEQLEFLGHILGEYTCREDRQAKCD